MEVEQGYYRFYVGLSCDILQALHYLGHSESVNQVGSFYTNLDGFQTSQALSFVPQGDSLTVRGTFQHHI